MTTIPLSDIYTAAYLDLKGVEVKLSIDRNNVSFEVEATKEVIEQMRGYSQNELVPVIDYVARLRTLRGKMIGLKGKR